MRDKEEVRQELIKAGVGCMIFEVFWLRKISLFAENLRATEHILGGVWCFFRKHWGRLVATETRIVFLEQKGVFGSIVESFNYSKINALEMTKGLIFAEMTITSGIATQQVQWIPKFQLTRFVQLVQGMLDEPDDSPASERRHEIQQEETRADIPPDVGLQLERLDQLRLKGILTDEEFETQKVRLLD
jgi:Bacterial PH domain/Short C-terminal domain